MKFNLVAVTSLEVPQLSERQIRYAGNDAIVPDLVFSKLSVSKLKERESRVEDIHVQAVDVHLNALKV